MVESVSKITAVDAASAPNTRLTTPAGSGVAFQALLERLDSQARELRSEADKVESTGDLTQAVGHAHASLREALQLSERIVEAWRESKAQGSVGKGAPSA